MSELLFVSTALLVGAGLCAVLYVARDQLLLSWRLRRAALRRDHDGVGTESVASTASVLDVAEVDPEEATEQKALPLSWPVRLFATLVAVLLLLLLNNTRAYAGLSPLPDEYFWQAYGASCLMIAWYLTHVWSYAVRIRGTALSVPGGWGFGSRSFDLNDLQHVEDEGRHALRLYFKDGARTRVTKHVEGYARLREALRGNGQMGAALAA